MTKSFQPSRAAIARLAALAFIGLTVTAPAYANGIDETAWAAIPPGDATTVDTPAVAESPDGSRLVVTRNADLTMSFSFNGGATKPIPTTGITATTQTAPRAIFFNGQFVLAHHGTDGRVYTSIFTPPSSFTPWLALSDKLSKFTNVSPSLAVLGNLLVIIITGQDNHIFEISLDGSNFAGVTPASEVPGNGLTTSSTAVTTILNTPSSPGELFLALIDASGHFRYTIQSANGSTTGWAPIPGSVTSSIGPAAVAYGEGRNRWADVATADTKNKVHWQEYDAVNGTWRSNGTAAWGTATGNMLTPSTPDLFHDATVAGTDNAALAIESTAGKLFLKILNESAAPSSAAILTSH
ncbi:MAG: hypothetical protein WDN46_09295 [Methylocella sp.]